MNHHHTNRLIVAATAIAIAFSACGDESTAPGVAVELPGPDVHGNETERFERFRPPVVDAETRRFQRLQPTVEVGRSQRLIEESIQDALDRRDSPVAAHPAQHVAV